MICIHEYTYMNWHIYTYGQIRLKQNRKTSESATPLQGTVRVVLDRISHHCNGSRTTYNTVNDLLEVEMQQNQHDSSCIGIFVRTAVVHAQQ